LPEKLKPGLVTNVDLFVIDVSEECTVDGVNDINDWYAAYVDVPVSCSQMDIVRQLQSDGADFIFLFDKNDDYHKLNSRAIQVPVFPLTTKNNMVESFMSKISETEEQAKKKNPDNKAEKSQRNTPAARLFITIPHRITKKDYTETVLIYSPANVRSFDYSMAISSVYSSLKTYMTFEPIVVVYKRPENIKKKNKNCYESTPYCAADPDGDGPFGGSDVVLASIRQKCVYRDDKEKWFSYIECFSNSCPNDFSTKCHETCLEKSGVSNEVIKQCVKSSSLGGNDNSILKSDYAKMKNLLHDMTYPILLINGNTYRVLFGLI
jgi:hypothetical protein